MAGVLDPPIAAAQTTRDGEIAATKRRLDELKSSKDLLDEVYAGPAQ